MADVVALRGARNPALPPPSPALITIPLSNLDALGGHLVRLSVATDLAIRVLARRIDSDPQLVVAGIQDIFSAFNTLTLSG